VPLRFYKSLKTLSITIDSTHVSVSRSLDKPLVNNNYLPIHFLDLPLKINNSFLQYLKRKVLILFNSLSS